MKLRYKILVILAIVLWPPVAILSFSNYKRSVKNREMIEANKDSIAKNNERFLKLDTLYGLKY